MVLEIYYLFFILFNFKTLIDSVTVSKCHYEGDFTIFCNKTKQTHDTDGVIRYIKKINGLQYNNTMCSFTKDTCSKSTELHNCHDRTYCRIENGWYNLPECSGHSYYTEVEYECRKAYYMCDKPTISNVFNGIIYSPFYPYSYKSGDPSLCFLTVSVPSDHFIEITIDKLNILASHKCILDYLHIQEYLEIKDTENLVVKERQWKPLKTLCGKFVDTHTKFIAKTNVISFRFQSTYNLISSFKPDSQDFNFKLFFQAIPMIPEEQSNQDTTRLVYTISTKKSTQELRKNTTAYVHASRSQTESFKTFSYQGVIIGIAVLILAILLVIVAFVLIKKFGLKCERCVATESNKKENVKKQFKKEINIDEKENLLGASLTSSNSSPTKNSTQIEKGMNLSVDSRKMAAERSLLLQDLSNSRLLKKYKSEQNNASTNIEKPKPATNNELIEIATRSGSNIHLQPSDNPLQGPTTTATRKCSGIYGADFDEDFGGVYGTEPETKQIAAILTGTEKLQMNILAVEQDTSKARLNVETSENVNCLNVDVEVNMEVRPLEKSTDSIPNEQQPHCDYYDMAAYNGIVSAYQIDKQLSTQSKSGTTTPRSRNVFNPLHVILKDKNKYYTTEFI